jgi:hypothetical protein
VNNYRALYLAAVALSAVLSFAMLHVWFREYEIATWCWAFLLTLTHGSLVFYVHARALKEGHVRFLYWGLGIHAARVVGILSLFLVLHAVRYEQFMPFIAATLTGYFCFLVFEVLGLEQGRRERDSTRT